MAEFGKSPRNDFDVLKAIRSWAEKRNLETLPKDEALGALKDFNTTHPGVLKNNELPPELRRKPAHRIKPRSDWGV